MAELVFKGLVFDIYHEDHQVGGARHTFEIAKCADAVRVYPVLEAQSEVVLIREIRHELDSRVLTRVVSGAIEADENPVDAAARELGEELGLAAESYEIFHRSQPMLKVQHTVFHVLARDARRRSEDLAPPDPLEQVWAMNVPFADLSEVAWSGAIEEDVVALGLLRLIHHLGPDAALSKIDD
jgi:8-oxo-dGTP pyrophosphatase MutT (NUDIX family)